MTIPTHNDRMLPIAFIASQHQMRRSLTGTFATDPVVPERVRRTRPPARADAVRVARMPALTRGRA